MPMTHDQIERKLRQHANEIVAIYDVLTEHTATLADHGHMLTEILRRLPEPPAA